MKLNRTVRLRESQLIGYTLPGGQYQGSTTRVCPGSAAFNIFVSEKCEVLHLGRKSPLHWYWLGSSSAGTDLGGRGTQQAEHKPAACSGSKVCLLGCTRVREVTSPPFDRPHLEYYTQLWAPRKRKTLISWSKFSGGLSRCLGAGSHALWKAEGGGLVHSGEEKALVGLNSSFPFVEWKPLRRLSSRRRQVLEWCMVWGWVNKNKLKQERFRLEIRGKKNHHEDSEHWKCRKAVRLNHWRFSRPEQSGLLDDPAFSRKLD